REARRERKAGIRAYVAESKKPARSPSSAPTPKSPSRRDRIRASCLREVGEHDLANMLLADPAAYSAHMDRRFAELPYDWDVERGDRDARRENDRDILRRQEDDHETIVRYAMGLMPKEERGAFEERLVADKEF